MHDAGFKEALAAEWLKFRHSIVPFVTLTIFTIMSVVGAFFMVILKDPIQARRMGLIGAKAQLAGQADWTSYMGFISEMVSVGGLITFGFLITWIFGREYADRTLKDLMVLPISRSKVALSKFTLFFGWGAFLSLYCLILAMTAGNLVGLPIRLDDIAHGGSAIPFSTPGPWIQWVLRFVSCALMTLAVSSPVAYIACIGKGYMAALGFVIATIISAQIVAVTGYGDFYPYAIPALLSQSPLSGSALIGAAGIVPNLVVLTTSAVGIWLTLRHWKQGDHHI